MKCLSVSQPFAELIVSGQKTIELRRWNTKFRGEFLIHAPIKIRVSDCKRFKRNNLITGAIVGKAELYDVKKYESFAQLKTDKKFHLSLERYQSQTYGFMIKNAKKFRIPIVLKGKLGFFDVELSKFRARSKDILSEIIDEEFKYQWIGRH